MLCRRAPKPLCDDPTPCSAPEEQTRERKAHEMGRRMSMFASTAAIGAMLSAPFPVLAGAPLKLECNLDISV
eukprot:1179791-Prorocentrum_minimum.AAC.5